MAGLVMAFGVVLVQSLDHRILLVWFRVSTREYRRQRTSTCGRALLESPHDRVLDVQPVLDELDFGECTLLAKMNHARKTLWGRIGEDMIKVGWYGFRPDSHSATEFL